MTDQQRLTPEQRKLVEVNYPLAKFLARKAYERNSEIDLEEVTSVAVQGLVSAALKYSDEGKSEETIANGKAFSGYARIRINGAIYDWQRDLDHVQRSYRAIYKTLLSAGYTKGVTLEDAAAAAGIDIEKAGRVAKSVHASPLSWEEKFTGRDPRNFVDSGPKGSSYDDVVSSDHDVESSAIEGMIKHSGVKAYRTLTTLQRTVIALHYRREIKIDLIATMLGVGIGEIRRAHTEAVLIIHEAMRASVHEQR